MNKRYVQHQESVETFDISSLIDVSFLLLIFFMVTATIAPRESDLGFPLPGRPKWSNAQPVKLHFFLEESGEVFLKGDDGSELIEDGTDTRELNALSSRLEVVSAAVGVDNVNVLLDVSNQAVHQRVVDVLNTLAAQQIQNVTFLDTSPTE